MASTGPVYSVVTVTPGCGCCSVNVNPRDISKECNRMSQEGFELVTAYEAMDGCSCCQNKSAVLIFRR